MEQASKNAKKQISTTFPFAGGALALDLTNTDVLLKGKRYEFLISVATAEQWWREAAIQHSDSTIVKGETTQWNELLLTNLKRLRDALRRLFMALIERRPVNTCDLEELNRVLTLGYQLAEIGEEGKLITTFQTTEPAYGAVLLPIALSALRVIAEGERGRLHKCANERCIGLFLDTTRSATRQWCSPECMNRARSLQHYREAKARKTRREEVLFQPDAEIAPTEL